MSKATSINIRQITLLCWLLPWQLNECSTGLILVNLKVSCYIVWSLQNSPHHCWSNVRQDSSLSLKQYSRFHIVEHLFSDVPLFCQAWLVWGKITAYRHFLCARHTKEIEFLHFFYGCEPCFVYTMFILSYWRCIVTYNAVVCVLIKSFPECVNSFAEGGNFGSGITSKPRC